jgi:hypothetical protein
MRTRKSQRRKSVSETSVGVADVLVTGSVLCRDRQFSRRLLGWSGFPMSGVPWKFRPARPMKAAAVLLSPVCWSGAPMRGPLLC